MGVGDMEGARPTAGVGAHLELGGDGAHNRPALEGSSFSPMAFA
jgi:hypothetical protein